MLLWCGFLLLLLLFDFGFFFVWQEDGLCVKSELLVPVKIDLNLAKSGAFKKESHFSCSEELC